jgi:hypothetical protein
MSTLGRENALSLAPDESISSSRFVATCAAVRQSDANLYTKDTRDTKEEVEYFKMTLSYSEGKIEENSQFCMSFSLSLFFLKKRKIIDPLLCKKTRQRVAFFEGFLFS